MLCSEPLGLVDRPPGDRDRVADAVAGLGGEHRHAGPLADHLQLGDRVRPLQVGGDEQRRVALLLEPQRQLARERGLTGTLQAGQHDHGRRVLGEPQPPRLAAEDRDELLVHDLDDLLRGVQRLRHLRARGAFLDPRDELPHHGQRDVRLEQGDANLAGGRVNVGLGQPSLAAQRGEDLGQPIGERLKHTSRLPGSGAEVLVSATGRPAEVVFSRRTDPELALSSGRAERGKDHRSPCACAGRGR